jgi:hypothetical protein
MVINTVTTQSNLKISACHKYEMKRMTLLVP